MAMNEVVEEVCIGDYELYLVYDRNLRIYQIGMQRTGQDMTDLGQQALRVPRQLGSFDRKAFMGTVQRWLAAYHLPLMASHRQDQAVRRDPEENGVQAQSAAGGDIVYITDGMADLAPVRSAEALMAQMRQRPQHEGQHGQQEDGKPPVPPVWLEEA